MKGCLNKIIWFLIIAFLALFGFKYFAQNSNVVSDVVDSVAENSSAIAETIDDSNPISNVLEAFGFNIQKPISPIPPSNYKPLLSEELVLYPAEPLTIEDFRKVLLYMGNENLLDLTIYYDDSYKVIFEDGVNGESTQENLSTAFDQVVVEYVDLFSGVVESQYQMEGNIFSCTLTIHLGSQTVDDRTLLQNQTYFEQAALNINTSLYQDGTLNENMNDKQKAKALFGYVTKHLSYDTALNQESYTGYGAVTNKSAVCQGYTALYNYLLKLNNIDCYGQAGVITESNTQHIWTVANLDGIPTYIDVTFGDPTPDIENFTDYTYFDVSKEFLSQSRTGVE